MKLAALDAISAMKAGIEKFNEAKKLFELLSSKPVFVSDGSKRESIEVAKKLMGQAVEHREVIEMAIVEIMDPASPLEDDLARLLKQAQDHDGELHKFLEDVKALVGAQFEVVREVIEAAEEAK